jgi:predicted transcriptional regulator
VVLEDKPTPAVTARKSLADPDTIVSMIDGKAYSSLKRHITRLGYTPESYREAFGLKSDYPMVAPGYSERRREIAMKLGLGRKAAAVEIPAKKARKPRAAPTEKATVTE